MHMTTVNEKNLNSEIETILTEISPCECSRTVNEKNLNSEIETELLGVGDLDSFPVNEKNLNSEIETASVMRASIGNAHL